jgi:hypothetical protein
MYFLDIVLTLVIGSCGSDMHTVGEKLKIIHIKTTRNKDRLICNRS